MVEYHHILGTHQFGRMTENWTILIAMYNLNSSMSSVDSQQMWIPQQNLKVSAIVKNGENFDWKNMTKISQKNEGEE